MTTTKPTTQRTAATWTTPTATEIAMNAEIGAYQDDLDGPPEPPIAREDATEMGEG